MPMIDLMFWRKIKTSSIESIKQAKESFLANIEAILIDQLPYLTMTTFHSMSMF